MKILMIGGTGVLGRSFARLAQRKNYQITALIRNPEKASLLQKYGVSTTSGHILDHDSLRKIVPEFPVILNFASAIPLKVKTTAKDWEANDKIRTEGVANILEALPAEEPRFYCQAGLSFIYGDHEGVWVDETTAVKPNARTQSAQIMEEQFQRSPRKGLTGVSFRFSAFYHQDAWHTQYMVEELKKKRLPIIGDGTYYWNVVHVDDAASAVLCAIEKREQINSREIINVTDDEPVQSKDFLNHLCHLLGVSEPTKMPQFIARFALGSENLDVLTASYRCRNEKMKSLGWHPQYRSFREGFAAVLQFI